MKKSKEISFINKLSTVMASTYQVIGRVEFEPKKYKNDLIPCMDILNDLLHEADKYFDDDEWDQYNKWFDDEFKKYQKRHLRWLKRQALKKEKTNKK